MRKLNFSSLHNAQIVSIALRAGSIAIIVNMVMLAASDKFGLVTARGGLLKLVTTFLVAQMSQHEDAQAASWLIELTGTHVFQAAFHFVVGLLMAVVFVKSAGGYLERHAWFAGLVAAILVWIINAAVILPLLGEGVAGSHAISLTGIVYFAVAHTAFFILLSLIARRRLIAESP
ncbi:hypothetical protein [Pseudomonas gingeri]|uniref:hypothetical protein n=1 Tax=Pseudomonas gingeri TaxID=117681 RepID=UPI0015A40291|nr:hypothetical protein [Pseudomonas gingeri]NWA11150.1 hypothetical protein [Pseudomonas gingeri]